MSRQTIRRTGLITIVLLGTILLAGCSGGGVPQEQYDGLQASYTMLQGQQTTLQNQLNEANSKVTSLTADLQTALAQVDDLAASQQLATDLTTISAYLLWYGYYYPGETLGQTDNEFISRLGTLIAGLDDADTQAAFYAYYTAESDYRAVLLSLPQDSAVWTQAQFDSWTAAGKKRSDALGQVGGYLYLLFEDITWFVDVE